ncbi:predicted protein [Sclerotinia sclerotiorum 1980 UF-70]|uniref:Uncharacterized protein n=1 Tax=Sclerotinia sclerotiorum (strain ATCC 18683 / 1980 / Ss-1) TaxID=665079 RepID=A7EJI7_SCLS1|nr:predicted protein [Sclerotinia sclerotiorum 1980 UF-70]EDO03003.1 predicted protein [Sclerotinia sclerotiorum 1980 UF-70]
MSLACFMDIPHNKLINNHYYYLNAEGSQYYTCGAWKLRVNTTGYRIWIPQQREFAYEPAEMRTRFIYNRMHKVIYREKREGLCDIGVPSLGRLIVRYRRGIMESCLRSLERDLERRGDSVRENEYFDEWEIDLGDWEWKAGKGYEGWLVRERKRLEDRREYSEYNVWVDMELGREEPIKQETVEEENTTQRFIENVIIKQENTTEQGFIKKEVVESIFIKKEIMED